MQCWHEDDPPPRVAMWLAVVLLCVASPLIGVGAGMFTMWIVEKLR